MMTQESAVASDPDERVRRLLEAHELERARWAADLHDRVLQGLGGLYIALSPVARTATQPVVRASVEAALAEVAVEIGDVRSLITELRPAALDDLGLEAAVEALAGRMAEAGDLTVRCCLGLRREDGTEPRGDDATTVYRVAQEALANVVRHAHAATAVVVATVTRDRVQIAVTDDGKGFDAAMTEPGFGLVLMRERVAVTGGTLRIASGRDGTSVRADVPLRSR